MRERQRVRERLRKKEKSQRGNNRRKWKGGRNRHERGRKGLDVEEKTEGKRKEYGGTKGVEEWRLQGKRE